MVGYYMRIKDKISDLEKLIFELENIFEICKLMIKNKGVLIKDNEVETLVKLRIIDNHFKEKLKK